MKNKIWAAASALILFLTGAASAAYQINLEPAVPVVNNQLTVTVLNNGVPQQGILVQFSLDGGTPVLTITDSQGKVNFIPLGPGTLSIYASTRNGILLASTSVSVYTATPTAPVPIQPAPTLPAQTGALSVAANRSTVRAGAPVGVSFTVTNNSQPVSGANVTLEGNASGSGTTDASGSVVLLVNATGAGTITATANKTGFVNGSTSMTARALEAGVEPFDTDGNGRIERTEAVDCVVRFFTQGFVPGTTAPVTRTTAVRVVVTFFTQPP